VICVIAAGGNPYPGIELNETFITRLKNGYRMEKPNLAPDAVYAKFSHLSAVVISKFMHKFRD